MITGTDWVATQPGTMAISLTHERFALIQPVFIVAQYKCGTSWLLSALAAHPAVIGLREIDIVRAAHSDDPLRGFFGTSAWCRDDVLGDLEKGVHAEPPKLKLQRPQSFDDLSREAALRLHERVGGAASPDVAMDAFIEATSWSADGHSHLVLKAADQIAVFDALTQWRPSAPKLAITRDGRDAAISGLHYRKLMAKEGAPWFGGEAGFLQLLQMWSERAEMLATRAASGELTLVRYEDLSADFGGTLGPVLDRLGLDSSPGVVEAINARTSFKARTGRERGSEGAGVIRKGAVGEWRDALSAEEKTAAWELAGRQLSALGYPEDGPTRPLDEALAAVRSA